MSLYDTYIILSPPALVPFCYLHFSLCLLWIFLIRWLCLLRLCCRPCSLQVKFLMVPPPFCGPHPQSPHRFLKEFHNWSRRNVLRNRILPPPKIFIHLLQPRLLRRLLQGGGYSKLPSRILRVSLLVILLHTLCWKPPRSSPIQWFIYHISYPKISTTCTTTLNKIPDTHGLAPSCSNIIDNHYYLFCAFLKFLTTAGHS